MSKNKKKKTTQGVNKMSNEQDKLIIHDGETVTNQLDTQTMSQDSQTESVDSGTSNVVVPVYEDGDAPAVQINVSDESVESPGITESLSEKDNDVDEKVEEKKDEPVQAPKQEVKTVSFKDTIKQALADYVDYTNQHKGSSQAEIKKMQTMFADILYKVHNGNDEDALKVYYKFMKETYSTVRVGVMLALRQYLGLPDKLSKSINLMHNSTEMIVLLKNRGSNMNIKKEVIKEITNPTVVKFLLNKIEE